MIEKPTLFRRAVWLAPFAYALLLAESFARLPHRIAIHFDAAGAPNRFLARPEFAVISLALVAATATVVFFVPLRQTPLRRTAVALEWSLAFAAVGLVTGVFWGIVRHNEALRHFDYGWTPVWAACMATLGAALAVAASPRRRLEPAPERIPNSTGAVIGEQIHRSALQSTIVIVFAASFAVAASLTPWLLFRIISIAVAGIIGYYAVLTAGGFRLVATEDALKVMWGFRRAELVPGDQIIALSREQAKPLADFGGYGARRRAPDRQYFLKGGTAVRVATKCGSLFLGTDRPDELIRLLAQIHGAPSA